jgi:3-hydroxyacyl-CoA dehydrogenase
MALKLCAVPVVAAPFSSALGGGCEICLHASFVAAASETHMGLVEASVGLIPAGGGTKELTVRAFDKAVSDEVPPEQLLIKVAENILHSKVSRNGTEAKDVFLTEKDVVVETSFSPTGVAKIAVLELSKNYLPKVMRNDVRFLERAHSPLWMRKSGWPLRPGQ